MSFRETSTRSSPALFLLFFPLTAFSLAPQILEYDPWTERCKNGDWKVPGNNRLLSLCFFASNMNE
eukprot:764027-Hanusia_phi.AAC.12